MAVLRLPGAPDGPRLSVSVPCRTSGRALPVGAPASSGHISIASALRSRTREVWTAPLRLAGRSKGDTDVVRWDSGTPPVGGEEETTILIMAILPAHGVLSPNSHAGSRNQSCSNFRFTLLKNSQNLIDHRDTRVAKSLDPVPINNTRDHRNGNGRAPSRPCSRELDPNY